MRVNTNNFFIAREIEPYKVEHHFDGDLNYTRDYVKRGDAVAVIFNDNIYILPNVIMKYPYRARYTPSGGPDAFQGFRYDVDLQLCLIRNNPDIDISKWSLISVD